MASRFVLIPGDTKQAPSMLLAMAWTGVSFCPTLSLAPRPTPCGFSVLWGDGESWVLHLAYPKLLNASSSSWSREMVSYSWPVLAGYPEGSLVDASWEQCGPPVVLPGHDKRACQAIHLPL